MHLFQDARHALLCLLLFAHFGKLTARNSSLLVPLLQLFVRQEVLSHNTRDLPEVVEDGKPRILISLVRRAELTELVVRVQCHRGARLAAQVAKLEIENEHCR